MAINLDKLKSLATIELRIHEEDDNVRGNAIASGDPDLDKSVEDEILARLEYDLWAWCCVEVRATYLGVTGSAWLGGCSYKDEKEFKSEGGYYDSMVADALDDLAKTFESQVNIANKIVAELIEEEARG